MLEKAMNILSLEQKNKYRYNTISLGLVKNRTSKKLIENLPVNFKNKTKFINENVMIKKFKYMLINKNLKNKVIKVHGNYIKK